MPGDEVITTSDEVVHYQASRDIGICDRDGNGIGGSNEGFGDIFVVAALSAIAGDLGNFKDSEIDVFVVAAIFYEAVCHLFWRRHACVREEASMERAGEVFIQLEPGEVCAVIEQQLEVGFVWVGVKSLHECVVLLRSGVETEGVDSALIRDADQFAPTTME